MKLSRQAIQLMRCLLSALVLVSLPGCDREPTPVAATPAEPGEFVQVRELKTSGEAAAISLAFSPDGRSIVAGCHDEGVYLWDVATGEQLLACEQPTVKGGRRVAVAFAHDAQRFFSSGSDVVRQWDVASGELVREYPFPGVFVHTIAVSADEKLFVGTDDGGIHIVDVATGQELGLLKGNSPTCSLAISPDGKLIVSGHSLVLSAEQGYAAATPSVLLWDIESGELVRELETPLTMAMSIGFSADGEHVVGSTFRANYVWDISTGEVLAAIEVASMANPIAWGSSAPSPSGCGFLIGGDRITSDPLDYQGVLMLWDWSVQPPVAVASKELTGLVCALTFSPDGTHAASGHDSGVVRIWRTPDEPASTATEAQDE